MQSLTHKQHIRHNISDSRCSECRADTERRFARNGPFKYTYVHEYLTWVKPRVEAIRNGENSIDARVWYRDFLKAMHRRITSHIAGNGRKWSDGYLERLQMYRRSVPELYLSRHFREFASRGASCLDY